MTIYIVRQVDPDGSDEVWGAFTSYAQLQELFPQLEHNPMAASDYFSIKGHDGNQWDFEVDEVVLDDWLGFTVAMGEYFILEALK